METTAKLQANCSHDRAKFVRCIGGRDYYKCPICLYSWSEDCMCMDDSLDPDNINEDIYRAGSFG